MTQHGCSLSSQSVHPGSSCLTLINSPQIVIGNRAAAYSALVLLRTGAIIQGHLEWSFQSSMKNLVKTRGYAGSIDTALVTGTLALKLYLSHMCQGLYGRLSLLNVYLGRQVSYGRPQRGEHVRDAKEDGLGGG